jgi:hypothetical protein
LRRRACGAHEGQVQSESYTKKIEVERRRLDDLEKKVKVWSPSPPATRSPCAPPRALTARVRAPPQMSRAKIEEVRVASGGVDEVVAHRAATKTMGTFENRLNIVLVKLNEALQENKAQKRLIEDRRVSVVAARSCTDSTGLLLS